MVMFRRSKGEALKENAASRAELALALAKDRKFRKQLASALEHGSVARRRAAGGLPVIALVSRVGVLALAGRLATDDKLRRELGQMLENLQRARGRAEKKRRHRLRNSLIAIAAGGATAAVVALQSRRWLTSRLQRLGMSRRSVPRTITESIEIAVPVAVAYNQWTQFEEFPLFMEGVEHVQRLDDARLRWVATAAGKRAEWDAKILEQHPDRQISWISEDGKETHGTVSFERRGEARARVRLSMTYQAERLAEAVGSAAGLDERRIRGDLERFKELVESRGAETGAWRGEISAGRTD
jgi:uncharacterized membrane protein